MQKIAVEQVVIVEGKYDKIRLASFLDALIVTTEGFGIYKDAEKRKLLRALAEKHGAILLTDPDRAGFQIRGHLKNILAGARVTNVYVPDILGKERRKNRGGAEGKLGVEGMETNLLRAAFERAGVLTGAEPRTQKAIVTKADFYALGLSGHADSSFRRRRLSAALNLPENIGAGAMVDVINSLYSKEEFVAALEAVSADEKP